MRKVWIKLAFATVHNTYKSVLTYVSRTSDFIFVLVWDIYVFNDLQCVSKLSYIRCICSNINIGSHFVRNNGTSWKAFCDLFWHGIRPITCRPLFGAPMKVSSISRVLSTMIRSKYDLRYSDRLYLKRLKYWSIRDCNSFKSKSFIIQAMTLALKDWQNICRFF